MQYQKERIKSSSCKYIYPFYLFIICLRVTKVNFSIFDTVIVNSACDMIVT